MDELKFKHFLGLKAGRDQFSSLKAEQLAAMVGGEVMEQLRKELTSIKARASACRWILRGLNVDKAIRKAKTNEEVGLNARGRRKPIDYDLEIKKMKGSIA